MNTLYPRFTNILAIANVGDGFIVMENPFNLPVGTSNLYKVDTQFKVLWDGELPRPDDPFVGKFNLLENGMLKVFSTDGVKCEIDLNNGKIINRHWGK